MGNKNKAIDRARVQLDAVQRRLGGPLRPKWWYRFEEDIMPSEFLSVTLATLKLDACSRGRRLPGTGA